MHLACEDQDGVAVFRLRGEVMENDAVTLEQAVRDQLDAGQTRDLVLDCAELEFIDSRGLEALILAQELCVEKLGQLHLAGCGDNVRTILSITRLAGQFNIHDEAAAAVRSLRP